MMDLLQRIQDTALSQWISESTWGYPIVGALHVLAIALFAGALWITELRNLELVLRGSEPFQLAQDVRRLKWLGLSLIVLTGALLFISAPARYYESTFFRIKMALLVLIVLNSSLARTPRRRWVHAGISVVLWAAVIFAARGIAFL